VLRKWHEGHNKGMEFRAFVKEGKMVGLSQKDDTACYDFLLSEPLKATIYGKVLECIQKKAMVGYKDAWAGLYGLETPCDVTFVVDVYVDIAPRHRVFVQDVSPLLPAHGVSPGLFEWAELEQPITIAEFRTLSEDSAIRRPKNYDIRFPVEIQNMDQLQSIIDQQN
jgi:hypothetical protein